MFSFIFCLSFLCYVLTWDTNVCFCCLDCRLYNAYNFVWIFALVFISLLSMTFETLEPCRVLRLGTSSNTRKNNKNQKQNKKKERANKKIKKGRARKKKERKKKRKISCLAEKSTCFWKRDDFQLFFEKKFADHSYFWKKCVCTPEGWMLWKFSRTPKMD